VCFGQDFEVLRHCATEKDIIITNYWEAAGLLMPEIAELAASLSGCHSDH